MSSLNIFKKSSFSNEFLLTGHILFILETSMDPPGFRRFEDPNATNSRPYYKTVPQDGRTPRKLTSAREVEEYLEKEDRSDVNAYLHFDFSRRFKRKSECEDRGE